MNNNERELLIEKFIPPTEIKKDGVKYWHNKHGEIHSLNDQPAIISYRKNPDKQIEVLIWYKNGLEHRKNNKPSSIVYNSSGEISTKWWYKNGKIIKKEICTKNF